MSIFFRERTNPPGVYNEDYTRLDDYHHSFNYAPRTSLLRFAISPGHHVFNNLDFNNLLLKDNRYVPTEISYSLEYDPRIRYLQGLKHVEQQNYYIENKNKNKISIDFKSVY